ncbi:MAG: DUF2752 domain-containing protein [Desulfarculaceae bacterium]|nr:DUF2752 domain-containing protein [Desulfarculaceae bacterium]MCF8072596.1 DUF2752 domain-containing protein [Desulfarculaceae bacterium]MCF8103332.1 DUF2752 domain-containing protein [Desulfarculaceae bacterium]MCF8118252.1 DUF2752 domain-containing protein [Desulfarculaceae bacterium]
MTWRLTPRAQALLVLAAICLGGVLAWLGPGMWGGLRTVCPFRALTGLPCPGCGMTGAMVLLCQGQLGAAVGMNPFCLLLASAALAALPWLAWDLIQKRNSFFEFLGRPWPKPLQGVLYLSLAANWAWNLYKF